MTRSAESFTVDGRVQQVGYRWWAANEARSLGLCGWVRNRHSGDVELLVIGEPKAIEALAAACAKGPPGAAVRSVVRAKAKDDGSPGFEPKATV
jgi:acylphosphatase